MGDPMPDPMRRPTHPLEGSDPKPGLEGLEEKHRLVSGQRASILRTCDPGGTSGPVCHRIAILAKSPEVGPTLDAPSLSFKKVYFSP